MSEPRYQQARPVLAGERLLSCADCGALIDDRIVTAHDRFHSVLSALSERLPVREQS